MTLFHSVLLIVYVTLRSLTTKFGFHQQYNAKLFYFGSNELRLFEDSISNAFIGRTDYTPPEYVISGTFFCLLKF